ncbi:hypothetical protein [Corallococcus llansteffanensis]|uniref:hypothetical protein n=1 Tax=Corallococcus llansteffanensis TaxID=2316731 RepID=UPI00142EFB6A|nr:hypothetical protein [Corallococcus llansteffanensis]
MATERKQQQAEQDKPAREASEGEARRPPKADEAKEGMPGYGQPDEEVREERLPDQQW